MTTGETTIPIRMPAQLAAKLDAIAHRKYLNRTEVIIEACSRYCQVQDLRDEQFPESTRNLFINLARYDDDFRKLLREALREDMTGATS